jgi:ABC-type transport system involved in multi-copper enzyme maturation permease subunit
MTTGTITPYRSGLRAGRDGFWPLLWAEWTKFRTVRGWVIGMIVAALLTVGVGLLAHDSCGNNGAACSLPLGPGGEAVADSFYFVRQPLAGNGSITVRVTSLTGQIPTGSSGGRVAGRGSGGGSGPSMRSGLEPWSKAGIIIEANTSQGAAYAAMMVTGAHGVRMQYNYTADTPGLAGSVSAVAPRWLRLTRSGDTVTGYDSADGISWTTVGTARLAGLPPTVQAGMFAASPLYTHVVSQSLGGSSGTGGPTLATAAFDHMGLRGSWPSGTWTGADIGGQNAMYPQAPGAVHQSGDRFMVTGSGDIAPDVPGSGGGGGVNIAQTLVGTFAGLIAVVVVATMFITTEYRRGLIRTTLTASPRRGQVLAAKAVVTGLVVFVTGLVAAAIALPLGEQALRKGGSFIDPVSRLTELRLVAGTAALFAIAAVLALAIGAMLRHSAVAVTAVIVVIVAPYILGTVLSAGATQWLLRVTPAAGFALQGAYPRYSQVTASYSAVGGYYPLAPWGGLAVLCGWAAAALGLAAFLLRRRDA